jgi:rhodanese-related sulfurtransferase
MSLIKGGVILATAVVCTALVIYLTPLKHFNLIDPNPTDVAPQEFWDDYQKNPEKYLFIDVRDRTFYEKAHAQGAISQPIGTLFDLRHSFPKDKTIAVICTSGRLAGVAYGFLEHWGYTNLIRLEGGMQRWSLAGLPLEGSDIFAPLPESD